MTLIISRLLERLVTLTRNFDHELLDKFEIFFPKKGAGGQPFGVSQKIIHFLGQGSLNYTEEPLTAL